jgi:hypothetical protein
MPTRPKTTQIHIVRSHALLSRLASLSLHALAPRHICTSPPCGPLACCCIYPHSHLHPLLPAALEVERSRRFVYLYSLVSHACSVRGAGI